MKIALFGGTFDPVHVGHLRAAEAAARHFHLDQVLFIPSGNPPHKVDDHLTPFLHRFAMVALACAGNPRFVPSSLETPCADGRLHYSINTVRTARRQLRSSDKLYFLIGLDAFLDLPHWKNYRSLLDLVDFVVVSRPGFRIENILQVIPPSIRTDSSWRRDSILLKHSTLHVLSGVDVPAASREIREAIEKRRGLKGLLPPLVEEYVIKQAVYSSPRPIRKLR
ncbi:MAG TPA: nicotinate-nucleotide adenylyltransferase [Terriglobia bacterium]|nr:nicotinate-nucleotide adenylyltransferase [Terriglobia bacterium]